jgi:hypothetical protein
MDIDAPCFLYIDDTVYGKYSDASIGIFLFFRSKIFMLRDRRSGATCFLYAVLRL